MLASLKGAFVKRVKMDDLSRDDIIIAIMGPTGSGKSTFIDTITGLEVSVGHSLESCTSEISTIKLTMPEVAHGDLVFVDTPGFDDTNKSDVDILKMTAEWLKSTYAKGIVLAGLLYFHRITDNRMAGTSLKNLRMFEELCGKSALQNVILVTTMWDEIDEEEGEERERELKSEYWRPMLERGSTTGRFMRTRESAFTLVDSLIEKANKRISLLLQQEMVDMRRQLPETSAGRELYSKMELLVRQRQELLDRIRDEMKRAEGDGMVLEPLQQEHEKLQLNLEETVNKMRELKLPLGKGLGNMAEKFLDIKLFLKLSSQRRELYSKMEVIVRQRQELLDRIRDKMKRAEGVRMALEPLQQEYEKLQINLEETVNKMRELNLQVIVPLPKRTRFNFDSDPSIFFPFLSAWVLVTYLVWCYYYIVNL